MRHDVTIIGAGVLGLSLAYHLGNRGVRVLVLEREKNFGMHASSKNAGMIRQLYRHPQLTAWAKRSIEAWPAPLRDLSFKETGSLIVGRTVPEHHTNLFQQRQYQVPSGGSCPAVFTASDGLLDSKLYLRWLFDNCNKRYVNFAFDSRVVRVSRDTLEWNLQTHTGATFSSPKIVNAAGAWLNDIFGDSKAEAAIAARPFARHLFVVRGWTKDFMPFAPCGFCWDEANDWYVRHWGNDARLVSICDKEAATPEAFVLDSEVESRLFRKLQEQVPEELAKLKVAEFWHCFRTYTDNQLPVCGEDPDREGLFWLAAFGGLGMSTSFAAAADAAAGIVGEKIGISVDFCPSLARGRRQQRQTA